MAAGVLDEAAAETAAEAADEAADAAVSFRMESLNSVPAWTLLANWRAIRRKKKLPLLPIFLLLFFAFFLPSFFLASFLPFFSLLFLMEKKSRLKFNEEFFSR